MTNWLSGMVLAIEVMVTAWLAMWAWRKAGYRFDRSDGPKVLPFVRSGFFILLFGALLHASWGVALLVSPTVLSSTPMAYLLDLFGQRLAGVVLLIVAALAAIGITRPGWQGLLLGSFQNFTLWLSASAAIASIISGVYPDGTIRSGWFVFADQLPIILFAALHAMSLVFYHGHPKEVT